MKGIPVTNVPYDKKHTEFWSHDAKKKNENVLLNHRSYKIISVQL